MNLAHKHVERVALLSVVLSLTACGDSPVPPAANLPQVEFSTLTIRSIREWDQFNGRISAVDSVDLRPRVSGYIQRVAFTDGEMVRKGQVLFEIDPRPYREALASAEARLQRAQASLRLAQAQDLRGQALVRHAAISREESDIRAASLGQGAAEVNAARADVALARLNLDFTQVRAPFDGLVGRALLTAGNLAQADQTLLTTVISQNPVYVEFDADEHSFLRYAEQTSAGKRPGIDNQVQVGLANQADRFPYRGQVDFLDNHVNPGTGTIRARAVLANSAGTLTPGLYARVRLEAGSESQALLIDNHAVLTDQDRKYVYVLGPENKALRKDVVLGRLIEGLRLIESGLLPGDKVVVKGAQKIFYPGMQVEPKEVTPATTQSSSAPAAPALSAH
ncbi:efflux RND transporter periplasmic adaptor subunit [Pseudomonas protegens]|uniref:efflux RND transporter periplasmic adaptor subunit n=1 Tax=Pseudomonas protegens TaxID=380021 RepID=UPI003567D32D